MATHSSTLAWKIPWTEEPGGLQSMGSLRVRHDWATSLSLFLSGIGEGNANPLQCSCLENPGDWGACWVAVYGVAQSRTRLKWLSTSSKDKLSSVHHWLHGHEFEQALGVGDGQGSLACWSPCITKCQTGLRDEVNWTWHRYGSTEKWDNLLKSWEEEARRCQATCLRSYKIEVEVLRG